MAQSGSNGLVEQFGQMGTRRIHMAEVQPNGNAEVDADDAAESGAASDHVEVGVGAEAVDGEDPELAVATA